MEGCGALIGQEVNFHPFPFWICYTLKAASTQCTITLQRSEYSRSEYITMLHFSLQRSEYSRSEDTTLLRLSHFRFSVTKRSNENRSYFWFLLDDQRYSLYQLYTSGTVTGSATIVLELTAGQIVRVENYISTIIYGTDSEGAIRSWFTGHMLYAL